MASVRDKHTLFSTKNLLACRHAPASVSNLLVLRERAKRCPSHEHLTGDLHDDVHGDISHRDERDASTSPEFMRTAHFQRADRDHVMSQNVLEDMDYHVTQEFARLSIGSAAVPPDGVLLMDDPTYDVDPRKSLGSFMSEVSGITDESCFGMREQLKSLRKNISVFETTNRDLGQSPILDQVAVDSAVSFDEVDCVDVVEKGLKRLSVLDDYVAPLGGLEDGGPEDIPSSGNHSKQTVGMFTHIPDNHLSFGDSADISEDDNSRTGASDWNEKKIIGHDGLASDRPKMATLYPKLSFVSKSSLKLSVRCDKQRSAQINRDLQEWIDRKYEKRQANVVVCSSQSRTNVLRTMVDSFCGNKDTRNDFAHAGNRAITTCKRVMSKGADDNGNDSQLRWDTEYIPGNVLIVSSKAGAEEWAQCLRDDARVSFHSYTASPATRRRLGTHHLGGVDFVVTTFDVLKAKEIGVPETRPDDAHDSPSILSHTSTSRGLEDGSVGSNGGWLKHRDDKNYVQQVSNAHLLKWRAIIADNADDIAVRTGTARGDALRALVTDSRTIIVTLNTDKKEKPGKKTSKGVKHCCKRNCTEWQADGNDDDDDNCKENTCSWQLRNEGTNGSTCVNDFESIESFSDFDNVDHGRSTHIHNKNNDRNVRDKSPREDDEDNTYQQSLPLKLSSSHGRANWKPTVLLEKDMGREIKKNLCSLQKAMGFPADMPNTAITYDARY